MKELHFNRLGKYIRTDEEKELHEQRERARRLERKSARMLLCPGHIWQLNDRNTDICIYMTANKNIARTIMRTLVNDVINDNAKIWSVKI